MKIGIDLGGSNLRVGVVGKGGVLEHVHKEPVGEPRDPETIVERITAIVLELARDEVAEAKKIGLGNPVSVGIGIAAMLRDHEGTVASSPHLRWRDVAFGTLLAKRLAVATGSPDHAPLIRVGVYNDVNAIVWGEYVAGAARDCRNVLGVYVGTGIGGGLIVNGVLVDGGTNCAGEIGHTKVRWDDQAEPCACGSRGCIEAYIGGSYVQRRITRELTAGARSSAIQLAGGSEHVTPSHVDQAAGAGDDWALGLWTELAPLLAVTLGNAVAILNPDKLVLGGGLLSRTPVLYEMVVATMMVAGNQPSLEKLQVLEAELGDDAGIVGAAYLAHLNASIVPVR